MTTSTAPTGRRYDLDWLRVLLILTVFVFHCTRFFDGEFWHVKNGVTYEGADIFIAFVGSWLMPLIFLVSGASLCLALGKGDGASRTGGSEGGAGKFAAFFKDKALRLLVPLAVSIFTHVMFQVYLEKTTHHLFYGSFWQFIPVYFRGWYGFGGNFAWMGLHLWYLLMLFVFTAVAYPLFVWLRGPARRGLDAFTRFLALPGAVYLLALPTIATIAFVDQASVLGRRDWGGWSILAHFWFFASAFVIVSSAPLQARIRQWRWVSTGLGILALIGLLAFYLANGEPVPGTQGYRIFWSILGLLSWTWMLTWLGHGMTYLNFNRPFLRYANEAVLPFYVMHQSVILTVGYFVVRWPVPDLAKFLIIAVSSFTIIMVLYEYLIRRHNVLRFLFGMKPLPRPSAEVRPVPGTPRPVPGA